MREGLLSRLRSFSSPLCAHHVPDQHRPHHSPSHFDEQPPRSSWYRAFRNLLPPQTSLLGRSRLPHATQPHAAYANYGVNIDMNTTTKLQVDRCEFICSLAKQSLQKQVEVTCLFELSSFILSLLGWVANPRPLRLS